LQASREISNGVNHWLATSHKQIPAPPQAHRQLTASGFGLAHYFSGAVTWCTTRRYTDWLVVSLG